MSHMTKIILKVIMQRIRNKFKNKIDPEQFFWAIKKAKELEMLLLLCILLLERSIGMQKYLYIEYINYKKVFDRVKHAELFKELLKHQIDGKDLRIPKIFNEIR